MGTEKKLNAKQKKTLADIYTEPTLASILFDAVISLLKGLGWSVRSNKRGSHYKANNEDCDRVLIIPKPHGSKKTLPKYIIEQIRDVLAKLGITSDSS